MIEKRYLNKITNLIFKAFLIFSIFNYFSLYKISYASTKYINGKSVSEKSVAWQGNAGCWRYAQKMYQLIWGKSFDNSFTGNSSSYNMLRNLSDSQLTLTSEHLKEYIHYAELGSVLRVSTAANLHINSRPVRKP